MLIGPRVSIAMGTKTCDWIMSTYFALFCNAAASAALQGVTDVVGVLEFARVSTTVTSYVGMRPHCQGTRDKPSGPFQLPLSRPVGSFVTGILARLKALHMAWFIWW